MLQTYKTRNRVVGLRARTHGYRSKTTHIANVTGCCVQNTKKANCYTSCLSPSVDTQLSYFRFGDDSTPRLIESVLINLEKKRVTATFHPYSISKNF